MKRSLIGIALVSIMLLSILTIGVSAATPVAVKYGPTIVSRYHDGGYHDRGWYHDRWWWWRYHQLHPHYDDFGYFRQHHHHIWEDGY